MGGVRTVMTMQDSAVTIEDVLALSPLQQGLFSRAVLGEADGGVDPYFITMAADVNGPLDVALLRGMRRCDAGAPSQPAGELRPS